MGGRGLWFELLLLGTFGGHLCERCVCFELWEGRGERKKLQRLTKRNTQFSGWHPR